MKETKKMKMKRLFITMFSVLFVLTFCGFASAATMSYENATIQGTVDYYGIPADGAKVVLKNAFKGWNTKYRTTTTDVTGYYELVDLNGIKAIDAAQTNAYVKATWIEFLYGDHLKVTFTGTTYLPLGPVAAGEIVFFGDGDADIELEFKDAVVQ